MQENVFKKIIAGEIPAARVYEDERTLAFLDINPTNKGHTLVVPKEEYENMYDLPEELFCSVMKTVKRIAPAIKKAMQADGINLIMNNEPAAGQIVPHAHVHIVPRFQGDGFKHWQGRPYEEGEAEQVAEAIREGL